MKFLFIQKWHKKFGIYISLFVILLAISGIALNHSEELKLNTTYVKMGWLMDLYQINPKSEPIGYFLSNNWITKIDGHIYFNNKKIVDNTNKLIGVVNTNDTYTVAYDDKIILLTVEGEILESLGGAEGVPAGMKAIGNDEKNNIVIQSAHGYYRVNLDTLQWDEYSFLEANWSSASEITEPFKTNILEQYRGTGLTIERVLLDLHSGRIIGGWGIYLVDIIALLFIIIAITGIWMWWYKK